MLDALVFAGPCGSHPFHLLYTYSSWALSTPPRGLRSRRSPITAARERQDGGRRAVPVHNTRPTTAAVCACSARLKRHPSPVRRDRTVLLLTPGGEFVHIQVASSCTFKEPARPRADWVHTPETRPVALVYYWYAMSSCRRRNLELDIPPSWGSTHSRELEYEAHGSSEYDDAGRATPR